MHFLNLSVENFGVFKGEHSFDLRPYTEDRQMHHMTIFSGHNGAGKTTLFQAMMLALHGSAYFGEDQYKRFILKRMHRPFRLNGETQASEYSRVLLSFQYIDSGKYTNIQVERKWRRSGDTLKELPLEILQDGQPPDVSQDDYQVWLDEYISPGYGRLCFFDAEQLDSLANYGQQGKILEEMLQRLLGLDLVQRLQVDLGQVISRQGSTAKIEHLYAKVLELRSEADTLERQLTWLQQELDEANATITDVQSALSQQERFLVAEGGTYAAKRPLLQQRHDEIKKEVESLSSQIHAMCTDLLPFTLIPELCLELSKRLAHEMDIQRRKIVGALWQDKLSSVRQLLAQEDLWKEVEITPDGRKTLTARLLEQLSIDNEGQSSDNEAAIIHHLAEPDQKQLRQWIAQVLQTIPQQVQSLGNRLRSLKEEQRNIEVELKRAPDDAILAPIHAEIARLQELLNNKRRRHAKLNEQIGSLRFQLDEKLRTLKSAIEQYEKAQKNEKQLKWAEQSRLALRTYKDTLIRQKLSQLEDELTQCFNRLCSKEHLLSRTYIDANTFEIRLEGADGKPFGLNNFSAGERQLYALALLWALRMVGNKSLPLAIDTPLARLDEGHRQRLLDDYIPHVSEQVLLFTTDTELDANLLSQIKPFLARVYRLTYNSELGETTYVCESGYEKATEGINVMTVGERSINGI
jgi:DNA sulfur modification protein DndD